jgi:hypothetical protein
MANTEVTKPRKEYTGTAKKILNYLCGGATPSQAAEACGVDDSYVSQLRAEPEFQAQILEKLTADFEAAIKVDKNYEEIEKLLSDRLVQMTKYMTNVDQMARVLKTITAIPKKIQPKIPLNAETNGGAVAPVLISLPIVAKNVFVVSPNSEVVKLNDKELVTLNSTAMDSLLKNKRERVIIEQSKPALIGKLNGKRKLSEDDFSDL